MSDETEAIRARMKEIADHYARRKRPIEGGFQSVLAVVSPEDLGNGETDEMRKMFFAGAAYMSRAWDEQDLTRRPDRILLQRLDDAEREITEYFRE